jgi:drug/metabolite transporter (DMT)-like permease
MLKLIALILIAEFWGVGGQICFKKSVNALSVPTLRGLASYLDFIRKVLSKPLVWIGFASIGTGLFFWLIALACADLSLVFPIDSMQYIVTLAFARIFLGEKVDSMKLAGTLLVVAGIIIVALS